MNKNKAKAKSFIGSQPLEKSVIDKEVFLRSWIEGQNSKSIRALLSINIQLLQKALEDLVDLQCSEMDFKNQIVIQVNKNKTKKITFQKVTENVIDKHLENSRTIGKTKGHYQV